MSARLTLAAPAKLNLYLHITGRRPDGTHTLDSLVAFAGLADIVTLELSGSRSGSQSGAFALAVSGPFAAGLTVGEDNLALRAARRLAAAVKPGQGGAMGIGLEKNIPVAAGLGGGAADAAAVLAGLASQWGVDASLLAEIAAGLGADVTVCLAARPTFMAGIGEALGPQVTLPEAGVVFVNPGLPLETRAVFRAYDEMGEGRGDDHRRARPAFEPAPGAAEALARALEGTANDLTGAALGLAPVIADVLGELAALKGCRLARMAGSGATCFGLFDDRAAAVAGLELIGAKVPNWWCWAGPLAASREAALGPRP
ncbi:MAG: 4-(cytidine 5'-diphospho)-2-C-methyl-D-erythritol kinase [Alphaproteobacteria bacterium]